MWTTLTGDGRARRQGGEAPDDTAALVDPVTLADVHPLEQVVLDRWWIGGETSFHVHAGVVVRAGGGHEYHFRS